MTTLSPPSEAISRLKDIHLRLQTFTNPPTQLAYRSPIIVNTEVFIQIKKAQFELEKAIEMLSEKSTVHGGKMDLDRVV